MIQLSTSCLVQFLKGAGYAPELQEETGQIYLLLKIHGGEFPLFFRGYESGDLLQLLLFLPGEYKKERREGLARLLHLLNKELDLPGFGMDEFAEVVFFRCMLPAPGGELDEKVVLSCLHAVKIACKTFYPAIAAVMSGREEVDLLIERAKVHG